MRASKRSDEIPDGASGGRGPFRWRRDVKRWFPRGGGLDEGRQVAIVPLADLAIVDEESIMPASA